jgi:protein-ribulosamine 3-kinase
MEQAVQQSIIDQLQSIFAGSDGWTFARIHGGSINEVYAVTDRNGERVVCKLNDRQQFPGMFEKEADGLATLRSDGSFRVPNTVRVFTTGNTQVIVMEFIEEGNRTPRFWENFGAALANMHTTTSAQFGFSTDNYMGALPQRNTLTDRWPIFFIQQRLDLQRRLADSLKRLPAGASAMIDKICSNIDSVFPEPQTPALLHGDLWSGNFLCDVNEQPVLIDPAVYYGHPAVDLGLTTLFGGYDRRFYEAYRSVRPFPDNWHQQWQVCNLYPLLIHVNLFGGSYGTMLSQTLKEITRSL